MDKKYILTDETKEINDHILHRIQAVKDFGDVKAGDLGGWIEKEWNLSHEKLCWAYNDAMVAEHARVCRNARICEDARIGEYANIFDDACISGMARIGGHGVICDNAQVSGESLIVGEAVISGHAKILGRTVIEGKARIYDGTMSRSNQYIVLGPIGSRGDFTTFFLASGSIMVTCGCFKGNITEFEGAVRKTHSGTDHEDDYISAICFARSYFKNKGVYSNGYKPYRLSV